MKSTLFVALILLIQYASYAQITFRGGFNISGIRDKDVIDQAPVMGIHFGGEYQLKLNPQVQNRLFFQAGLVNSFEGYNQRIAGTKHNISFLYTTLPITFMYKPTAILGIEGGIAYARMMSATYRQGQEESVNVKAVYHHNDWRLVVGAVILENKPFSITLRYFHGLKNTLTYPDFDNFGNVKGILNDLKNQTLQIGVVYNLRFNENFY